MEQYDFGAVHKVRHAFRRGGGGVLNGVTKCDGGEGVILCVMSQVFNHTQENVSLLIGRILTMNKEELFVSLFQSYVKANPKKKASYMISGYTSIASQRPV